jgi:hypothetical protein
MFDRPEPDEAAYVRSLEVERDRIGVGLGD